MSLNLISGMFQQRDKFNKRTLTLMCLLQESDTSNTLKVFLWQGQQNQRLTLALTLKYSTCLNPGHNYCTAIKNSRQKSLQSKCEVVLINTVSSIRSGNIWSGIVQMLHKYALQIWISTAYCKNEILVTLRFHYNRVTWTGFFYYLVFHCLSAVHTFLIKICGLGQLALALVTKTAILFPGHETPSMGGQLGFIAP